MTLTSGMAFFPAQAQAATMPSPGTVRAQVNGKTFAAIAVGNTTYLNWGALQLFNTPYEYLGNGKFALTGSTVQGVIYHGITYLPWASVAPKVKAAPLKGGGFNFTSIAVKHDYHVEMLAENGSVGSPDALEVFVLDGNNLVPHQRVQVTLNGSSYLSGYGQNESVAVTTDRNGTWLGGLNDSVPETVSPTVQWLDPNGKTETKTASVTFKTAGSSSPSVPPGDTVVASVPITTFQNAILFNAKGAGQSILFQLDTGAYVPLITKQAAKVLQLPNLGNTVIQGVGGQDEAYLSRMTLTVGGHPFNNIPCIVDNNYSGPSLFGYGFFTKYGYDLLISQKNGTMTILQ